MTWGWLAVIAGAAFFVFLLYAQHKGWIGNDNG